MHVPFFMRWPARIRPGQLYAPPVAQVDIAATAAAVAGTSLPNDRVTDGVHLLPFLTGQKKGQPHRTLFWRSGGLRVVMHEGWKLQRSARPAKEWLYDLNVDPTEQRNLAGKEPGRLKELGALMDSIDAQQSRPLWPSVISIPIPIDQPLGAPPHPDDEVVYWFN